MNLLIFAGLMGMIIGAFKFLGWFLGGCVLLVLGVIVEMM